MNYHRDRRPKRGGFFSGASLSSAVRMLIAWNTILFLLQFVFRGRMEALLGLWPDGVLHGEIWRLVSYMFLHGGFVHLFLNMLALWMFGSDLEYLWGTKRFTIYYFFCGIGAGITTVLLSKSMTIGASGAIYGLLLAFGVTYPNRPILLYFILPIPAKYFVILYGGIELLATVFDRGSGVAHVAHLGGLVFGFFFLKGLPGQRAIRDWQRRRRLRKFKVLEFRDGENDWRERKKDDRL